MAIRRRRRIHRNKPEAPKLEEQFICLEVPCPQAVAALEVLEGCMADPMGTHPDDSPLHTFHKELIKEIDSCKKDHGEAVGRHEFDLADWEDRQEDKARSKRRRENRVATQTQADEAAEWLRKVWKGEIECDDQGKILAAQALAMPYLVDT